MLAVTNTWRERRSYAHLTAEESGGGMFGHLANVIGQTEACGCRENATERKGARGTSFADWLEEPSVKRLLSSRQLRCESRQAQFPARTIISPFAPSNNVRPLHVLYASQSSADSSA